MAVGLVLVLSAVLVFAGHRLARAIVGRGLARRESAAALGIFRIAYAAALLPDLVHIWLVEPLIARRAVVAMNEVGLRYSVAAWILVDLALLLGWRTRLAVWLNAAFTLLGCAAGLLILLVVLLSIRLRQKEISTMNMMGCSRTKIVAVVSAELAITAALSVGLAIAMTFATLRFSDEALRLLIL